MWELYARFAAGFWLAAFITVITLFTSCEQGTGPTFITNDTQPLPALNIPWTQENSVVCFGTSLTYGFRYYGLVRPHVTVGSNDIGSSAEYLKSYLGILSSLDDNIDSSYPGYLASRLKIRVYNQGYVGATIIRALQLVEDSVLSKNPALVLLEFGANDFLQGINVDTAEARMTQLVKKILKYRSTLVLISFFNPDMINRVPPDYPLLSRKDLALAYFEMLKRVAKKYSLEMVEYPLKGVFGDKNYMSDLIHPNGLGYKKMEENISQALLYTFYQNGMLK